MKIDKHLCKIAFSLALSALPIAYEMADSDDSVQELLHKIKRKRKENGSNNNSRDIVKMINDYIDETKKNSSQEGTHRMFSELLKITNGHKIIQDCLDAYVTKYPDETANEDDDEYAIHIDFRK